MIDWGRAVKEKTTDLDGRKVERIVYPDEEMHCNQCNFFYKEGKFTRCQKYPDKWWRPFQKACAQFEYKPNISSEEIFKK